jgi:hypothetical protein
MASKSEAKRRKRLRLRRQQEAHLTQLEAERRYRESLQRVLNALEMPDLFRNLPKKESMALLMARFHPPRIDPAEGTRVPRRVMEQVRKQFSILLKAFTLPVMPGYDSVSLEDFSTAGYALAAHSKLKLPRSSGALLSMLEQLRPFSQYMDSSNDECMRWLKLAATAACMSINRVNQTMYLPTPRFDSHRLGLALQCRVSMRICPVKPESRVVSMDGKPRPACRIGLAVAGAGIRWAATTPAELGSTSDFADLPMQACIQSHALSRLRERLDTCNLGTIHSELFFAFEKKQFAPLANNRALAAFEVFGEKVGYLLVEIVDGAAVVRTFLFITNSGTPEGTRLDHELRVGKMEKEYLQIDRLSAFVKTDLPQDQRVRNVFERVGLGHLCRLDPKLFGSREPNATGYAKDFVKYMGLG